MHFVIELLMVLIIVLITTGISIWFQRKGIDYLNKSWVICLILWLGFLTMLIVMKKYLLLVVSKVQVDTVLVFMSMFLFSFFLIWIIKKKFVVPRKVKKRFSHLYLLEFNNSLMITKVFDIIFQQVSVLAAIRILVSNGFNNIQIIGMFSIVFCVFHIPLLLHAGKAALFHISVSLPGAAIMTILILNVRDGFVYSLLLHWYGYVFARLFFGLIYRKKQ